jgi:putative tryptophan/tyrosine transport system substrate-binding protein
MMRRREFIALAGSAAVAWPVKGYAQEARQTKRIGVLLGFSENVTIIQNGLEALRQVLAEAGWKTGSNLQIEYRWTEGDILKAKHFAQELVALKPDLILSASTPATAALHEQTSTIPIVFVIVSDPIGAGFVRSLARPGGNITGFINFEGTMGGKWLELLKEAAPNVTHAVIIFNPETAPGRGEYFLPSFHAAGQKLAVETRAIEIHSPSDIGQAVKEVASRPNGGLVAMSDSYMSVHFPEVMDAVDVHSIPTVYGVSNRAKDGALISYTPDTPDLFARSAAYVNRVLRGENPSSLPVQLPTKYELTINLKTARALGLRIPQTLLATADEVIE